MTAFQRATVRQLRLAGWKMEREQEGVVYLVLRSRAGGARLYCQVDEDGKVTR